MIYTRSASMNIGDPCLQAAAKLTCRYKTGFTLVECLAAIAILIVIVTAGVPAFSSATNSWKLTTAANETLAIWQLARVEAIKSNRGVVVCVSSNQDSANPSCGDQNPTGWIAFADRNRNFALDAEEPLLRIQELPRGMKVAAEGQPAPLLAFGPDGLTRSSTGEEPLLSLDVVLCLSPSRIARRISIRAGSSMTVEKVSTETNC